MEMVMNYSCDDYMYQMNKYCARAGSKLRPFLKIVLFRFYCTTFA